MIRRPPRSTPKPSSAASDVYKRQILFVFTFFTLIPFTFLGSLSPITSSMIVSQIISIFLFSINFFWSIFSALKLSRLWCSFTLEANFVRNIASSTAAFPPPTTATSFSLKKNPSHVAQADTPNPLNSCSDFIFNHLA